MKGNCLLEHAMKFTVHFTDDRAHAETIEANTPQMAAWKFVQTHPRQKAVQLKVAAPPEAKKFASVVWWSSEFLNRPTPSDEQEPDLILNCTAGPEPAYEICGGTDELRLLAIQLLNSLDKFSGKSDPHNLKIVYGISILPADCSARANYLYFVADPNRRAPEKSERIRCFLLIMLLGFAGIGVWTAITWIF